jgi:predicted TIM-barrel fold metal-dependent hydrolase
MTIPTRGAIDCDVHPSVPDTAVLLPYLDDYWRDQVVNRHIHKQGFQLQSYPPNSPLSCRPDWRPKKGLPGSDIDLLRAHALDTFGSRLAICNVLHGAIALFNEDMAAALISAVNDYIAKEWLDREPRLRASILLPLQSPELAVKEIERLAGDRRFVQVLVPVLGEMPLGRRAYWPIYQACEKHGLAVGMHAGSTYRTSPTAAGWPSYQVEDYVVQSGGFENQLLSFIAEGVFQKFPKLKLVCIESGFTWLPTLLWRVNKTWRGVRAEVPWLDRPPADIIREHVRFTLQPLDLPASDPQKLLRVIEHVGGQGLGSDDLLLFSTDYPHWHFDGDKVLPDGLPDAMIRKILVDNPLAAYPRLSESGAEPSSSRAEEKVP